MLFFSLGLPGGNAEWCDSLINMIAGHEGETPVVAHGDIPGALDGCSADNAQNTLIISRWPSTALRKFISESGRPYIVVLRDPRDCVVELIDRQHHSLEEALRAVSAACAALTPMLDSPQALIVRHEELLQNNMQTVQRIARSIKCELSDEVIAGIVSHIPPAQTSSAIDGVVGSEVQLLSDEERTIIDGALSAYADLFFSGTFGVIEWGRKLFLLGDNPTERAVKPIDITGRSRCLIYGPYLAIAPGNWVAILTFAINEDAIPEKFLCEVCTTVTLGYSILEPEDAGVYKVELRFEVADADLPIELRIFSKTAPFEGHLLFGGAILQRL